ncbi:disease resistance protein RPS5-like [Neltuma alba]|uniref:disease resistance protein RPS5-like n=1 Tax=Neltuma alba TaxID=207710 RepID=UPI0010A492A2|nr:disease resistance protein RPS5-like [Prosopis alba]
MEQVVEIIWDITKYLCGCAKQEAGFICELEGNLQSLEHEWNMLAAKKKDVEAQIKEVEGIGEGQRTDEVGVWLQSIQKIEKEVKDNLDQGAQETENKCLSKCCPKNCKSSYKVGKNVAKMLTEVDKLTAEGQRFGKDYQITHKPPHKGIGQIPLDGTVGQDLIFDKVWSRIEANNVGVIGLYGTGGVGKTTLLKKISNELGKRKPDFLVIWVVVSKERNLDAIMDNIRKSAGIGDVAWSSCNSREEKSSKILHALERKKFALLLDDVWERLDLNSVGVPYPKDSNFESKVLFTTRLEDVCEKMQAQESFKVDFLNEKEALELFYMKVGEKTLNSHPRIKVLAEEMAAECRGLPLALSVVGVLWLV